MNLDIYKNFTWPKFSSGKEIRFKRKKKSIPLTPFSYIRIFSPQPELLKTPWNPILSSRCYFGRQSWNGYELGSQKGLGFQMLDLSVTSCVTMKVFNLSVISCKMETITSTLWKHPMHEIKGVLPQWLEHRKMSVNSSRRCSYYYHYY